MTVGVIIVNVLVFVYELSLPTQVALERFVRTMGVIPYQVVHRFDLTVLPTLFTSMFLHAGFIHLAGNMLFLWIFGNNVEDTLGSLRFAAFYLFCGLSGSALQILVSPDSLAVIIGASGAIAGVLGAYILLFPKAQIETLIFFGYFVRLVRLPAFVFLGLWILLQFISGIASLGIKQVGGVAWFAHIGGFIAGFLLVSLFQKRRR
jgi:membrane associated rhomboid family serine protease